METPDAHDCRQRFETLAARMTAKPATPFGMTGVALFASRENGPAVSLYHGVDLRGVPLTAESTVCLASVGKLTIALLILKLVDAGTIRLDDTLRSVCGVTVGDIGDATIRGLLSHRAGAPSTIEAEILTYSDSLTKQQVRALCRNLSRVFEPQPSGPTRVAYSDVAFALLVDVIETQMQQQFPECLESLNQELGTRLQIGRSSNCCLYIDGVPSEHADSPTAPFNSAFWHELAFPWAAICGAPHDGMRLLAAFAPGHAYLRDALRREALTDPDEGMLPGGLPGAECHLGVGPYPALAWHRCAWGLGVELKGEKSPHWTPAEASAQSYGHVGVSGTLVWHEPTSGISWGIVGTRSSFSGWLLRYGPMIGKAALDSLRAAP